MSEIARDLERAIGHILRTRGAASRTATDAPGLSPTGMLIDALITHPVEVALQIETGHKAPPSLVERDRDAGHDAGGAAEAMGEDQAGSSEDSGQGGGGGSDVTRT